MKSGKTFQCCSVVTIQKRALVVILKWSQMQEKKMAEKRSKLCPIQDAKCTLFASVLKYKHSTNSMSFTSNSALTAVLHSRAGFISQSKMINVLERRGCNDREVQGITEKL